MRTVRKYSKDIFKVNAMALVRAPVTAQPGAINAATKVELQPDAVRVDVRPGAAQVKLESGAVKLEMQPGAAQVELQPDAVHMEVQPGSVQPTLICLQCGGEGGAVGFGLLAAMCAAVAAVKLPIILVAAAASAGVGYLGRNRLANSVANSTARTDPANAAAANAQLALPQPHAEVPAGGDMIVRSGWDHQPYVVLMGYAGAGKSTLVKKIASHPSTSPGATLAPEVCITRRHGLAVADTPGISPAEFCADLSNDLSRSIAQSLHFAAVRLVLLVVKAGVRYTEPLEQVRKFVSDSNLGALRPIIGVCVTHVDVVAKDKVWTEEEFADVLCKRFRIKNVMFVQQESEPEDILDSLTRMVSDSSPCRIRVGIGGLEVKRLLDD